MTSPASRAGALALIGGLSVLTPVHGVGTALLFLLIAVAAYLTPAESTIFDRLATRRDRESGRLRVIAGFALIVGLLATLTVFESLGLSGVILAMGVLVVTGGYVGETALVGEPEVSFRGTLGFVLSGSILAMVGYLVLWQFQAVETGMTGAFALFVAAVGALGAALYRTEREVHDPIVLIAVAMLLWFVGGLGIDPGGQTVAFALALTGLLGVLAYVTDTASIAGMLSGVLLAFLTFVLGGVAWFVLLAAFFVIGGLSTKYRYQDKAAKGVAESDEGKRGTGNVLSNGLVPLVVVVIWGYATGTASPDPFPVASTLIMLAFAGAVATALADTLASEIGALYDAPRLITSLEPVSPGTDGAVSVQGHVAGTVGAAIVAGLAVVTFPALGVIEAGIIVAAGFLGMSADSILGATIEGRVIGNDGVNLLATCVGALVALGIGAVFI